MEAPPAHTASYSFVLIPGAEIPADVDAVWAAAKAERGARLRIVTDPTVTFDAVDPDPHIACVVAKADRDRALGFACKPVDGPTLSLTPAP